LVSFSARFGSRKIRRKEVVVFAGLINQVKAAVGGLLLKYLARASVAIPFVIAFGFALAATTVMLVERFGHVAAYWFMAAGLAAIGLVAAVVVSAKEHEEGLAEQKAEVTDTQQIVGDATVQAMAQAPLAVLGALFSAPGGATTVLKVARMVGRNWPLVLLLAIIGLLFWPTESEARTPDGAEAAAKPNGSHPLETYH
jgi:hypothetical protein